MSARNKSYLVLVFGLILLVVLLVGAVVGGIAGYVVASRVSIQALPAVVQPAGVPALATSGSVLPIPAAETPLESVIITDQTSAVAAVNAVLPAVVTVINQGSRGVGSGTGFFISSDGYVVTNNHVAEGGQELMVIYAQGGRASATLVGSAPEFDLAVLKVDGLVPAVATWGDSSNLPLGAHLIAIGSALGRYRNTVTAGVLSGFNRDLGDLRGLLQTDAAINSGNSGGPLINLAGQVVGINTAVVRGEGFSAGAEGLGFAIPSNVAKTVAQRLIETGDARPSFLGVQYEELNPQAAIEKSLSVTEGALLQEVVGGSPAAQAGLQVGDIITAVNGQHIDERHPLVSLLIEHVAGDTISLEILRDGTTFQTDLTLGERA
jgi:2-alkenal reductase